MRDELRNAVEWSGAPLQDKQAIAAGMKELQQLQADAKALGLEPPKTLSDVAAVKAAMQGKQAAQSPQDDGLAEYHRMAQESGTTLTQAVRNWHAAEQYLERDPVGGIKWLLESYNVPPEAIVNPRLAEFCRMANANGSTLTEALERYTQAEAFLEREPVQGILWLCNRLGIDPRQLVEAAMRKAA